MGIKYLRLLSENNEIKADRKTLILGLVVFVGFYCKITFLTIEMLDFINKFQNKICSDSI